MKAGGILNICKEKLTISIIGLGLIGGSLAKALHHKAGIKNIYAMNRSQKGLDAALAENVITKGFTSPVPEVFNADVIFICTPAGIICEYIELAAKYAPSHAIITDAASIKGEIVNYVNRMEKPPVFIGGHPMAGTEKTGYNAGYPHLFENAFYVLTPSKSSTEKAFKLLEQLVISIGAINIRMEAEEHDYATGGISHLPHVIASALVNFVKQSDTAGEKMKMLAAGGFKDITRIASSSPEIWESIIMGNNSAVSMLLGNYIDLLLSYRQMIDRLDKAAINDFFSSARDYRNQFTSKAAGKMDRLYELTVDVEDKPGVIADIASILGDNRINIKNINVSNSREFENGCLKITLQDDASVEKAFKLLATKGYNTYK